MSKIARIPISTGPAGVPGLVRWIKRSHPGVYLELGRRLQSAAELNGLGIVAPVADPVQAAVAKPSMWANITNAVKDIVAVGLPLYQQNKLFSLQVKRAEAGQPLLDPAAISDISSVKVGVDSATRNTGLLIVGGVAAVFLLSKLLRR